MEFDTLNFREVPNYYLIDRCILLGSHGNSYLQWTTTGGLISFSNAFTCCTNSCSTVQVSGTPLSGQEMNWYCVRCRWFSPCKCIYIVWQSNVWIFLYTLSLICNGKKLRSDITIMHKWLKLMFLYQYCIIKLYYSCSHNSPWLLWSCAQSCQLYNLPGS